MYRTCFLAVMFALPCGSPGESGMSARAADEDASLRLVAVGVLQKTAERNGQHSFVITDTVTQSSFRIIASGGTDLSTLLGRRIQVVGRLESGSDLHRRTIVAEKLIATDKVVPAHFVETNAESAKPPEKAAETTPKSAAAASSDGTASGTSLPPLQAAPSRTAPQTPSGAGVSEEGPILGDAGTILADDGTPLTEREVQGLLRGPASGAESRFPWANRVGQRGDCSPNSPEWLWGDVEYLWWAVKGMDLPPLVTTSPALTPPAQAGVLGAPGTGILFGNSDVFDGAREGLRLRMGAWLGPAKRLGMAVEYFALEDEQLRFDVRSSGAEIIARPYQNTNTDPSLGARAVFSSRLISYPDLAAGAVQVEATSSVESFAAYLRGNILSRGGGRCQACQNRDTGHPGFRLDLLGGYRYLSLEDSLVIRDLAVIRATDQWFGGSTVTDSFVTNNDFQGGEIGLLAEYHRSRWWFEGVGKLAVGRTHEQVDIRGSTVREGSGTATTYDAGLLALSTNIGNHATSQTDVLLEFGLTAGYLLTRNLQVTCGYTVIYWPHVVRAGDQVDLNVNASYLPPSADPPSGPAQPAFAFRESSFWTQGLSLGLDYRW